VNADGVSIGSLRVTVYIGGLRVTVSTSSPALLNPAPIRTEHPMNPPERVSDDAVHAALRGWYTDSSPWSPTETTIFDSGEIEAMRAAIGAADEARRAGPGPATRMGRS
jgi:hypothetical protein